MSKVNISNCQLTKLLGDKIIFLLLATMILINCLILDAFATAKEQVEEDWHKFASNLSSDAKRITIDNLEKQYEEYIREVKLSQFKMSGDELLEEDINGGARLYVFVSRSMGKSLLRYYVEGAKRYGAILVFKGLPDNSWKSLANFIGSIAEESDKVAMQIDDEAFNYYGINNVPSFVLVKEQSYLAEGDHTREITFDKVDGNIGIKRALELFSNSGDLRDAARGMLAKQD